MMNNAQLAGYMAMLYTGLEAMNVEQRRIVLKHFKEARRMMDFSYPNGKIQLDTPTLEETNAILCAEGPGCGGAVLSPELGKGSGDGEGTVGNP